MSTVFSGLSSFDVSAMKCTPHWMMISASTLVAVARKLERIADDVRHAVKNVRVW